MPARYVLQCAMLRSILKKVNNMNEVLLVSFRAGLLHFCDDVGNASNIETLRVRNHFCVHCQVVATPRYLKVFLVVVIFAGKC